MNTISHNPTRNTYKIENVADITFKKDLISTDDLRKNEEIKKIISLGEYSIDMDKLSLVLSNNI